MAGVVVTVTNLSPSSLSSQTQIQKSPINPMNETNNNRRNHHLHALIFVFLILTSVRGEENDDGGNKGKRDPSLIERAIGICRLESRWDAIRSWAKLAWMNLQPPDASYGQSGSSGAQVMKEAATKSFETSKETVEQAAASTAKVASEAVEKTAETVKRTISSSERDNNAEL